MRTSEAVAAFERDLEHRLTPTFRTPPLLYNESGELRRVGVELEFTGLHMDEMAAVVQRVFGGRIEKRTRFEYLVAGTELGDFNIELDSSAAKERAKRDVLRRPDHGQDLGFSWDSVVDLLITSVAPYEIGTPPIPIDLLGRVDVLREELRLAGAKGLEASPLYAFALQFNPEVPSFDTDVIVAYLRAFLVLYDWIRSKTTMGIARNLLPYVDPFPLEYVKLVLAPDYRPSRADFIADYLRFNPTRNRPLDLLPLLAFIDERVVAAALMDEYNQRKVKKRPTFHYRLPSSLIDNPNWTIERDWDLWLAVEQLATDADRLRVLMVRYRAWLEDPLRLVANRWADEVEPWVVYGRTRAR